MGVLVEMNAGRSPSAIVDVSRVAELAAVQDDGDVVRHRRGGHLHPGDGGAAATAARPRDGLPDGRLAPDPQPRRRSAARWRCVTRRATRSPRSWPPTRGSRSHRSPASAPRRGRRRARARRGPHGDRRPRRRGARRYAKAGMRNAMARAICGVAVALRPGAARGRDRRRGGARRARRRGRGADRRAVGAPRPRARAARGRARRGRRGADPGATPRRSSRGARWSGHGADRRRRRARLPDDAGGSSLLRVLRETSG